MDYLKSGNDIYEKSFSIIRKEADLSDLPKDIEPVLVRMMHASGQTDLRPDFAFDPFVVLAGRTALENGAPILCDSNMVAFGVTKARLPAKNDVVCTLRDPRVASLAERIGNTRSAAAVELWRPFIEGSVVVIGNAPTTLFYLLERLDEGWPKPAVIIGLPVGFVGAAESKQELSDNPRYVPFLTLNGRRGGSAMAAAAVNAIAKAAEI